MRAPQRPFEWLRRKVNARYRYADVTTLSLTTIRHFASTVNAAVDERTMDFSLGRSHHSNGGEDVNTSDKKEKDVAFYLARRAAQEQKKEERVERMKEAARQRSKELRRKKGRLVAQLSEAEKRIRWNQIDQRDKLTAERMNQAKIDGIKVCIDIAFAEKHEGKERQSLLQQASRIFSPNTTK
jgi:polysaccharide pyruvyl transferase WcaK-like protein